jgi:hypothetical protein
MPPRKKQLPPTKETPIQETPVVFFLKIVDESDEPVVPAGLAMEYSDIGRTTQTTNYTDILKSMEGNISMNSDLLKQILDKSTCESYSRDTACFWCCHAFDWNPSVLPISYDAYKNVYTCEGNYCSPECALAYLYGSLNMPDTVRWNRHTLLRHMYASAYVTRDLTPSPPRSLLRMFGGPLDIAQFRGYVRGSNDIVSSALPPIRLVFPTMNIQGPLRDLKRYVSLSTDVVEKASQQLRLKRSKPVHTNVQTLDMCLKAH